MNELYQYKILLVDDRPENLISLSAVLKKAGYTCDKALSGKEALKMLLNNKYGLIVLDVQMPEMSGLEVAELIKGSNQTKDIPLIFLSANAVDKEFFNKGYEVGALDYLAKPVDVNLLLLKVKNFLFLHHSLTLLAKANVILEKKVVEAQISFESLYYSLPQDVYLINKEGIIVNINRTGILSCGMNAEDLLHRHFKNSLFLDTILSEFEPYFNRNELKENIEFQANKTDNTSFYGEATITPTLIDGDLHIQVFINDITERVKSEESVRKSELRLTIAQKIAKIGDWEFDHSTNRISWSEEMYNIYNCDPKTYHPNLESLINLTHQEDRKPLIKWVNSLIFSVKKPSIIIRIINPDSSIKYIRGDGEICYDEKGHPFKSIGTAQDITELKNAELEIRESEAFNKGILSSLGSYIAVIDKNGHVLSVNESWKKAAMQMEADALLKVFSGENYFEVCEQSKNENNSFAEKVLYGLKAVLNKNILRFEIEYPSYTKDQERWYFVSVSGFEGDNHKVVLRFVDITERKKSESALIENKKLVQSISEASPDAVIIINGEGIITKWDAKSEALFGWKESDVIGTNLSETIMPQRYHEMYLNGLKQYVEFKEGPLFKKTLETTALNQSGVEFYISLNITVSLLNGKLHFIGFIRDISERKKAEQLLFDSQRLYKNLLDNMNDGFMVDDIDGKLTFANEQFCEIFGIKNTDLDNIVLENYVDPEYRAALRERHNRRMSGDIVHDSFEFKGIRANGENIWLEVRVNPIIEKGVIKGTQSVIRDITKKKKAEEVLVESEIKIRNFANHLNQVLEDERTSLAREIHDELGQQLAGIKFGISSFKKMATNNPEIERKINDLLNDVDITIQDLRKIATSLRPGILDTLGLASSIEWLVKGYEKKKAVRCKLKIDVDEQQFNKSISTCFFRICQESLTNISKHTEADEIMIELSLKNKKLSLIIKDNGKGMTMNKQQNPFSMGLIGMRERANSIGGTFEIESGVGKGTLIKTEVIIN